MEQGKKGRGVQGQRNPFRLRNRKKSDDKPLVLVLGAGGGGKGKKVDSEWVDRKGKKASQ